MERNIDTIKRLNYEIGRRDKKIADQQTEITKAKKDLDKGLGEVRDIFRAVLVGMTVGYGKEAPEGTYTIELPVASVSGVDKNFKTFVRRTDYNTAIVTAVQNPPEQEVVQAGEKVKETNE